MNPYLSIIVPFQNEEESIVPLIKQIQSVMSGIACSYELILVDDGSTDDTWQIIEGLKKNVAHLRGIKFRKHFGQTAAMVAGFDKAEGSVLITMDGDLQNDPADIPALLEKMNEGYDIVCGWRKNRKDRWLRVISSKVANTIISIATGLRLHDYGCSLRVYRSECIKPIGAYGEMHRFFPVLSSMTGARLAEVAVRHHERRFGISKYGFERVFKVLSDLFAIILIVKFSSRPLLGFFQSSLPFIFLGLFFSAVSTLAWMLNWTAGKDIFFIFTAGLSFIGAFHLIAMGIVSELVVSTSDLSHTQFAQVSMEEVAMSQDEQEFDGSMMTSK